MLEWKAPTGGFWCCVAAAVLALYAAAYGVVRRQDVLIDDVIIRRGNDGIYRSGTGITSCANGGDEGFANWQRRLGPPAELVFFPLCEIETKIRWLREFAWRNPSGSGTHTAE